ncbi:hypothetical protein SDC9_182383 [bioreactor metagenome]|uniref:Uncharacterized protein n=1 Tax=bioreactor metagenome TaxID=1076179 RepID=A0A645H9V1_9ZZZZ
MAFAQRDKGFCGGHTLCQERVTLPAGNGLTVTAVMAVRAKQRRLIIAQMAQPISRKLVATHGADQARDLPRTTCHQRAL